MFPPDDLGSGPCTPFIIYIPHIIAALLLIKTRTTRTPAFWGYPLWPHDYPYYWPVHFESQVHTTDQFISDPKSKQGESRKISEKLKFYNFVINLTRDTMAVIICGKYGNNRSRTENVTERTRFSKSWSNDLEDIGQGQRSSHATHLLLLVIICTKYGKNPSRTVDATERTRFSRSRPNDLEDIGQGQRSLYATHPLILVIICTKYGKNPSRSVDFFSRLRPINFKNLPKIQIFRFWENVTHDTPSNNNDHLCHI